MISSDRQRGVNYLLCSIILQLSAQRTKAFSNWRKLRSDGDLFIVFFDSLCSVNLLSEHLLQILPLLVFEGVSDVYRWGEKFRSAKEFYLLQRQLWFGPWNQLSRLNSRQVPAILALVGVRPRASCRLELAMMVHFFCKINLADWTGAANNFEPTVSDWVADAVKLTDMRVIAAFPLATLCVVVPLLKGGVFVVKNFLLVVKVFW